MGIVALWATAAALCVLANKTLVTADSKGEHELGGDDESDSAPFMVVLQHGKLHSCGGSLVSPRTVLTSAWCARGDAGLWALAPAAPSARRRVVRAAQALGSPLRPGWLGAAGDIAVLELERPFDSDAGSRPILTAGAPDDCGAGAVCHVVRARGRPPRLRIVDAARVPGDDTCGAVASGWPALRYSALCLSGPTLCSTDRGAGVVCDGQLCGVLSRSARSPAWRGAVDEDASCGDVHVALSVPRWRRFLHCAHILRACGREDGECAQQCTEQRLIASSDTMFSRNEWPAENASSRNTPNGDLLSGDIASGGALSGDIASGGALSGYAPSTVSSSGDAQSWVAPSPNRNAQIGDIPTDNVPRARVKSGDDPVLSSWLTTDTYMPAVMKDPTRTTLQQYKNVSTTWEPMMRAATPARSVMDKESRTTASRPSFEFEPNRADFKAGEYGDNAADYGAVEEVAGGALEGSGDGAPNTSVNPAPNSGEPMLSWSGNNTPTWRTDLAPSWRNDSDPTLRAVPDVKLRVDANHTQTGVPTSEDMQKAEPQPRAAAMSLRTSSFVFASITLLVTNYHSLLFLRFVARAESLYSVILFLSKQVHWISSIHTSILIL